MGANDILRRRQIEEAIMMLIKDCGKKLRDTFLKSPVPQLVLGTVAIVPAHIIVNQLLLLPSATPQWGLHVQQAAAPKVAYISQAGQVDKDGDDGKEAEHARYAEDANDAKDVNDVEDIEGAEDAENGKNREHGDDSEDDKDN
ncbi:hypothetical protein HOY80DRAFT_999908 [Tuber brumale]|nr:hypothetical protein HOY80DRAFT_999908 [Tuber brumale]